MSHNNSRAANKACGFTLTEIAVVVAILGVILGAIWVAIGAVGESSRAKEANNETLAIVNGLKTLFGNKRVDIPDRTDITQQVVNNGFAPPKMIAPAGSAGWCTSGGTTSPCNLAGPWPTSVVNVISWASVNGVGVLFSGLSSVACRRLVTSYVAAPSLIQLWVNNTMVTQLPPYAPAGTLGGARPTASQINDACATIPDNAAVEGIFGMD